ncbi:MAG: TorF family putative porin [Gemmatimonadota bacterium]
MRRTFLAPAIIMAALSPMPGSAQEVDVSANAGWVSEYYYRGILQKASSASAGLDLAAGGFYAGTWGADVGDGAEIDVYAGYGLDLTEMASLSLGGTGYFYTGQFDDTYLEANVGLGVGPLALEYSFGQYSNFGDEVDYSFIGLTAERNGVYATIGAFGTDMALAEIGDAGKYLEAGFAFSAADLDWIISGIWNDSMLSSALDDEGEPTHELTLVAGVSKTFTIR